MSENEPVIAVVPTEDGEFMVGINSELSPADFTTIIAQLVRVYCKEWLMGLPPEQLLENVLKEVQDD